MADPPDPQVPSVGVLLFVLGRHLERRVFDALHAAGFDFSLAQGRLAQRLDAAGTRVTDLAESAQVTKQTASFLVDQMERKGYVVRVADPGDARARLIRLAPRGLQAQALAREVEAQVYAEWAAHVGPDAWAVLQDALVRLRAITDPYADR